LLDGLELASPYQWELAHRDVLIDEPYYNRDQIQVTILCGIEDYAGLRGWVNKPGTDGTVVIAGASLDAVKLRLDFSKDHEATGAYTPFDWAVTGTVADFGFGVLPGLDHGTIVSEVSQGGNSALGTLVLRALKASNAAAFGKLCADLEALTASTYVATAKDVHQQFILHAVDEYGVSIPDFTVEFFIVAAHKQADSIITHKQTQAESQQSDKMNRLLLGEIHTHTRDASFRRLLVNLREVREALVEAEKILRTPVVLSMRLYVPDRDRGIRYDVKTLQNIVLHDPNRASPSAPTFFYPNTTTLIEMCVNRVCDYVSVKTTPKKH
jgi:hypothetical protein